MGPPRPPPPPTPEECPSCHRRFTAKLVSKDRVDSSMIAPKPAGGIQVGRDYTNPYSHGEDWITYKLTYRCKHCGNEWTKLSEREVEIPRTLIKDEY